MSFPSITFKDILNPQNIYDFTFLALTYMPTKPTAVAMTALLSSGALYLIQPQTLLSQVGIVAISSGLGYGAALAVQQTANKLWDQRWEEVKANATPISLESQRALEAAANKAMDDLFSDPDFLKKFNGVAA